MAEPVQDPDPEEVRTLWFAAIAPDQSNLNFEDFKLGLEANDEIFATIQELIKEAYDKHGLENPTFLPGCPDFEAGVSEVTAALLSIFENVPAQWMNAWSEALTLDIWNKDRAAQELVRVGKKPSPTLADSPTTGKEAMRFSQPPPPPTPEAPLQPPEKKEKGPLPLHQRIFALEVIDRDHPSLKDPSILEVISVRCVPEGRDLKLVKNYKLSLFVKEFEDIFKEGSPNEPQKWTHGKLVYFYRGSENRASKQGRGTRRLISSQKQFEVAVAHLLNTTDGDCLTFTFFPEDIEEKRLRLVAEARQATTREREAKAAARAGTLKQKKMQDIENASYATKARKKREVARANALARSKAEAPPVPQKDPRRKLDKKKVGVGDPSDRIERRSVPHEIVPRTGGTKPKPLPASTSEQYQPDSWPTAEDFYGLGGSEPVASTIRAQKQESKPKSHSKNQEALPKRTPLIEGANENIGRLRIESGFQPQPPSPAIRKRDSITSKISRRASISLHSVPGLKNIFKRGSMDVKAQHPPVHDLDITPESFYKEFSRRTYVRGGGTEQEVSIERLKEIATVEKNDDNEVEEQELPDEYEDPAECLVNQLNDLQNRSQLTQIQPSVHSARWIDCCHLFQLDPQEIGLDERVKLAGLRTSLYQYQAYGVYWQMKTSRAVGGGFVADEMGLGKTLSFLAYIVAERQLSWLWQDVEAARAIDHPRHLKETGQYPGARCPSRDERRGWITCPCASSSPTSQWPAKGGVRLACVPQSLIPTWAKQWNEHVNEREVNLGMRLVIAHDSSNSIPAPGFGNVDARHARNIKELSAKRNIFDSKASAYLDDTAKPNQDRYLVLATTQSYKKWVKRFEYTGQFVSSVNSAEKLTWVNGKGRGIVFGLAMIDECHEEFSKEKGHAGVLSNIPLTNNPFIWGYSGTPILNTPRSIEGVLSAIEQHFPRIDKYSKVTGWEQDQTLSQYRHNNFDLICKDFEKHIKNKTGNLRAARHIEKALASFLARFMIRRTAESTWFGRPLIELKKHIHQDVFLAHNPKYDDKLVDLIAVIKDEAREKFNDIRATLKVNDPLCQQASFPTSLTFNQICRVEWRLRIIASFPFLVTLASVNHKHHLNLTTEEAIKYNGTQLTKSPYFTYLRQITNSSSKCIWLHHYITELLQTIDVEMKEQKLVIMTQFNPVALILKLFIEKIVLPKDQRNRVGLICAGMKARERTAVLDAFIDAIDHESGQRKQKNDTKILIGTTRLIGTGLQLTRAANLVLMEPDYEFYRELQAVARVHRIGQRNERSYSFRLINEGSEIEMSIVKRQDAKGELHGKEVKTKLLSEVIAKKQGEERKNGTGSTQIHENLRNKLSQEDEKLIDQFPIPFVGNPAQAEGQSSGLGEIGLSIHGPKEEDNGGPSTHWEDLYDA